MRSIEDWLNGLGLGKYSKVFAENDVDLRALPHLNSNDLQELGVSLGHRKVMLAAIAELRHDETGVLERKSERPGSIGDREGEASGVKALGEPGPDLRLLSVLFCDMVEFHELIGAVECGGDARSHQRLPGSRRKRGQAVRRSRGEVSWRRRARLFRMADGL